MRDLHKMRDEARAKRQRGAVCALCHSCFLSVHNHPGTVFQSCGPTRQDRGFHEAVRSPSESRYLAEYPGGEIQGGHAGEDTN